MHVLYVHTHIYLDENCFLGLLVKFIHRGLKQRERERSFDDNWVLGEAMNGKNLQNGGTFRNVLVRRIDEVITPYFSQIIAHIDQNCNLDIFDPGDEDSTLSQFWLSLFNLTGNTIDFSLFSKIKRRIATNFACKLPFSWFVKATIDDQCRSIPSGLHLNTFLINEV